MKRRQLLQSTLRAGAVLAVPGVLWSACRSGKQARIQELEVKQQHSGLVPVEALTVRRSTERGHFDHGWLNTYHSFSFARYHDPQHMGFRALRVINEDRITSGQGFPMHPHRDMEIITYILDGALEHKDSLGNGSVIRPNEVQRMTAGRGIRHSEFNPSSEKSVHLLQIWVETDRRNHTPSYEQRPIQADARAPWKLIASPPGGGGVVSINQDANIYACRLPNKQPYLFENKESRHTWLQLARGQLTVNGITISAGDAIHTGKRGQLHLQAESAVEALVFDLA
jgi:quercetin 2,3-dioxygenase